MVYNYDVCFTNNLDYVFERFSREDEIDPSEIKATLDTFAQALSRLDDAKVQMGLYQDRYGKVINDENGLSFLTQGDNNDMDDKNPIPAGEIIGVWTGTRIPLIGSVMLFMQKPIGLIVCIFIPIACFVGYELLSRYKKDKASKNDIDALRAELEALKKEKENSENK